MVGIRAVGTQIDGTFQNEMNSFWDWLDFQHKESGWDQYSSHLHFMNMPKHEANRLLSQENHTDSYYKLQEIITPQLDY